MTEGPQCRVGGRRLEAGGVGFENGKPERSDESSMSDATKIVLVTIGVSAVLGLGVMAMTLST